MPWPVIHVFRLDYHIKLKSEGGVAYRSGSPPRGRRGDKISATANLSSTWEGTRLRNFETNPGRHNYCLHSRGVRPDPPIIINYSLLSFRVLFIRFQFQRALFFFVYADLAWRPSHGRDLAVDRSSREGKWSQVRWRCPTG